jgi:hypothetical protein
MLARMRRSGRGRAIRIAGCALAALLIVLGLAQLLLPSIAAQRIKDKLTPYGSVESVSVSAFPAIELLWHSADSATVHARSLSLQPAHTASLLHEASGIDHLEVFVANLKEGPLRLTEATLHKRGAALAAQGTATAADVAAALPPGVGVTLVSAAGGSVHVRVNGGLFGLHATVDALAEASSGRLVVRPLGPLISGLHITLLDNRHVHVTAVEARALPTQPPSYRLGLRAVLH